MKKLVSDPHPDYIEMAPVWQKCRDARVGQRKIYAGKEKYLPRLYEEDDDAYKSRMHRTPFFGASGHTMEGFQGMLFRKDPDKSTPTALEPYLKNIDMGGRSIEDFVKANGKEVLTVGRVGILTDYPQTETIGLTVADVESMGLRPSLAIYLAESIINWRTAKIGNATVLAMVVLREFQLSADVGEWGHETRTVYRVLDLHDGFYRQRLMSIDKHNQEVVEAEFWPMVRGRRMGYIPFVIIGTDNLDPDIDEPPLTALVDLNLHHYQNAADYHNGLHWSGCPTPFITGHHMAQDEKIYIGGPVAKVLSSPDAKAFFLEVQGNFDGLRTALDDMKKDMAVLGARLLEAQKAGVEAEGTHARRQAGEQSILARIACNISDGIEKSLRYFADWLGIVGEIEYEVNKDYLPATMTPQEMAGLVSLWQSGLISGQTAHENLQAGEIIKASVTFEEEQARIAEAPPMGAPPLANEEQPVA